MGVYAKGLRRLGDYEVIWDVVILGTKVSPSLARIIFFQDGMYDCAIARPDGPGRPGKPRLMFTFLGKRGWWRFAVIVLHLIFLPRDPHLKGETRPMERNFLSSSNHLC